MREYFKVFYQTPEKKEKEFKKQSQISSFRNDRGILEILINYLGKNQWRIS